MKNYANCVVVVGDYGQEELMIHLKKGDKFYKKVKPCYFSKQTKAVINDKKEDVIQLSRPVDLQDQEHLDKTFLKENQNPSHIFATDKNNQSLVAATEGLKHLKELQEALCVLSTNYTQEFIYNYYNNILTRIIKDKNDSQLIASTLRKPEGVEHLLSYCLNASSLNREKKATNELEFFLKEELNESTEEDGLAEKIIKTIKNYKSEILHSNTKNIEKKINDAWHTIETVLDDPINLAQIFTGISSHLVDHKDHINGDQISRKIQELRTKNGHYEAYVAKVPTLPEEVNNFIQTLGLQNIINLSIAKDEEYAEIEKSINRQFKAAQSNTIQKTTTAEHVYDHGWVKGLMAGISQDIAINLNPNTKWIKEEGDLYYRDLYYCAVKAFNKYNKKTNDSNEFKIDDIIENGDIDEKHLEKFSSAIELFKIINRGEDIDKNWGISIGTLRNTFSQFGDTPLSNPRIILIIPSVLTYRYWQKTFTELSESASDLIETIHRDETILVNSVTGLLENTKETISLPKISTIIVNPIHHILYKDTISDSDKVKLFSNEHCGEKKKICSNKQNSDKETKDTVKPSNKPDENLEMQPPKEGELTSEKNKNLLPTITVTPAASIQGNQEDFENSLKLGKALAERHEEFNKNLKNDLSSQDKKDQAKVAQPLFWAFALLPALAYSKSKLGTSVNLTGAAPILFNLLRNWGSCPIEPADFFNPFNNKISDETKNALREWLVKDEMGWKDWSPYPETSGGNIQQQFFNNRIDKLLTIARTPSTINEYKYNVEQFSRFCEAITENGGEIILVKDTQQRRLVGTLDTRHNAPVIQRINPVLNDHPARCVVLSSEVSKPNKVIETIKKDFNTDKRQVVPIIISMQEVTGSSLPIPLIKTSNAMEGMCFTGDDDDSFYIENCQHGMIQEGGWLLTIALTNLSGKIAGTINPSPGTYKESLRIKSEWTANNQHRPLIGGLRKWLESQNMHYIVYIMALINYLRSNREKISERSGENVAINRFDQLKPLFHAEHRTIFKSIFGDTYTGDFTHFAKRPPENQHISLPTGQLGLSPNDMTLQMLLDDDADFITQWGLGLNTTQNNIDDGLFYPAFSELLFDI